MGATAEAAFNEKLNAKNQQRQSMGDLTGAENERAAIQQTLGTDQQVNGNVDPRLGNYLNRIDMNETAVSQRYLHSGANVKATQRQFDEMNALKAMSDTGNGGQMYTWTDDKTGEVHYATSLASVPYRYNASAKNIGVPKSKNLASQVNVTADVVKGEYDKQNTAFMGSKKSQSGQMVKQQVDQYNSLMDQAQKAAEGGDFDAADKLKAQADAITKTFSASTQQYLQNKKDTTGAAQLATSSPEAKIVGGLLQEAKNLQDPESDAYKKMFGDLTGGALSAIDAGEKSAERSMAAERRGVESQIADTGAARGSARNPLAQQSISARAGDAFATTAAQSHLNAGTSRAQVISSASQFMDQYANKFAQDAVGFADAWTSGVAGVRDAFQNNLAQLHNLSSGLSMQFQQQANMSMMQGQANQQAQNSQLLGAGIGAGSTVLGSAMGAMSTPNSQGQTGWGQIAGYAVSGISAIAGLIAMF